MSTSASAQIAIVVAGVEGAFTSARAPATALIGRYCAGPANSAPTHQEHAHAETAGPHTCASSPLGLTIETETS